jgi:protein O-mannosyl-transferase
LNRAGNGTEAPPPTDFCRPDWRPEKVEDSLKGKAPGLSDLIHGKPALTIRTAGPARFLLPSVIFLTILAYSATPRFGFVFDDMHFIVPNPYIRAWRFVPQYFTSTVVAQERPGAIVNYYRPVFLTWLRLNHALFGLNPAGWHLTTLALHLLVTWAVYLLALRVTRATPTALVAAAVFGLHPVHLESVAWISGVTDPLAAAPMLGSFLVYQHAREPGRSRAWWIPALFLYALAILAKENALVLPMLVFVYEWLWRPTGAGEATGSFEGLRSSLKPTLPFLAVAAVYVPVRMAFVNGLVHIMNPLPTAVMFLTLPSVLWAYLKLLVWPYPLSIFYDTGYVASPKELNFLIPSMGLAGAALLLGLWSRRREEGRAVTFAIAWLVLPILPVLDLRIFPAGETVHDRYLYFSSIGFAILVSLAWRQFVPGRPRLRGHALLPVATAVLLAVAGASATGFQSVYWANDLVLYSHAVAVSPNKAIAKDNLAASALDQGMTDAAIRLLRESLREKPDMWFTWYGLGYSYYRMGRFAEADRCLSRALELNDAEPDPYFVLGLTRFQTGQPDPVALIRRAIQIQPRGLRYHFALGMIYKSKGELARSLEEFRAELANDPEEEDARRQIVEISPKLPSPAR